MNTTAPPWVDAHPDLLWWIFGVFVTASVAVILGISKVISSAIVRFLDHHADEHKSQAELNRKFSERLGKLEGVTGVDWEHD